MTSVLTSHRSTHPSALVVRRLWRYESRLLPWPMLVTTAAIGTAWGVASHLDTAAERMLVAVLTTMALCTVLDDPAAQLTAASPTSLAIRRAPRATIAVIVLGTSWLAILAAASLAHTETSEPSALWGEALVWGTLAASQLAVAAASGSRGGASGSILPGLFVSLSWIVVSGVPSLQRHLQPVPDHITAWLLILAGSLAVIVAESRDPAS